MEGLLGSCHLCQKVLPFLFAIPLIKKALQHTYSMASIVAAAGKLLAHLQDMLLQFTS